MNISRFFTIMAMLITAVCAHADDYILKEGENALDGYQFSVLDAIYTAESDCKVLVEAQEVFVVKHEGVEVKYSYVPGSTYAYAYEVDNVKAGEKVSVHSDFTWTSKIRLSVFSNGGPIPVKDLAVTPQKDQTFAWYTSGNVTVNFNKNIGLSGVKLKAGEKEYDVDDVHVGSSFGCNVTNALNDALKDGTLKPGDKFQLVLTGVRDASDKQNLYNGDGVMTIEYLAPYPQSEFKSVKVGDVDLTYMQSNNYDFLSYFSPDGEDGLFVVEFDGKVGNVGDVFITMGNLDLESSGKFHRSSLPYTIDGNKIYIDARGTLRTIAVLFPAIVEETPEDGTSQNEGLGTFDTEHITLTVSNVRDEHGNAVRTNLPGSVGSFSIVMNYKELVDEAYIDGDNKADGDEVKGGEEIKLWLSNPDIKFEGMAVSYFVPVDNPDDEQSSQEQKVVVVNDFTCEPDGVQGEIITFNMPSLENAIVGTTVRVALHNASSADGMPHYLFIEFKASGLPDCISTVVKSNNANVIYRMNGVKIDKNEAKKGMFIVNGKTMMIK